jgi:hypothetical protein
MHILEARGRRRLTTELIGDPLGLFPQEDNASAAGAFLLLPPSISSSSSSSSSSTRIGTSAAATLQSHADVDVFELRKNGLFFECFPYVCPEPVLMNDRFYT